MTTDTDRVGSPSFPGSVRFNVLGPVTVTDETGSLNLGGPKQRTVLAVLIAHAGRTVSADSLVDAVYGEEPHQRARRTVQTYVSSLRAIVGDVIERQQAGWRFIADRSDVDSQRFEDLVDSARDVGENSPESTGELLREALGLWRGHPYSDIEAHGHLETETTRLNELREAAQAARIDADLAAGRHSELIGEIEGLLAEHPYQERFRAQHMLALYRSGRQKEALHSYTRMRDRLVEELGVDPTPELQALEQQILEQDESLALPPPSTIRKQAVLIVDPGEPLELARLDSAAREELLSRAEGLVDGAVNAQDGHRIGPAGTAFYALFEQPARALAAARTVCDGNAGLRISIDWGDIEASDGSYAGPPLVRAARLVAAAHRGQVLLSHDAQEELAKTGDWEGMRIESLGEHAVTGLDDPVRVYQLLVQDPPANFPPLVTDRVPPPLPGRGHHSVPGYELREPIGHGSIGTIYKAYQPSVGREVAVEMISRADSSDADFIRRFEADVQRLSLLEHPHILPVLDYWRDTEGAFIVYPYHRGGGLQDSIGTVDADRAIAQIGSALAYAHSYGLVHGRLAPNRIVLDESGNTYLYGFPIAGHSQLDPESSAYARAADGEKSVADDVYALAVLAETLRTGLEPDPDAPGPSVAATSVDELLIELLPPEDHPEARYTETRNPYKGLSAFHESDAGDFHGRETVVRDLVEKLALGPFLAVVGPSGIGKSSVVRAGLIPALRRGDISGSDRWLITDMIPGSQPFRELERALERVAVSISGDMRELFVERDPSALSGIATALPADTELLVVVDQFEELFTMTGEDTRRRFIELIGKAVEAGLVRVVVTLRADYLDHPLRYSAFAELLKSGTQTIGSPSPEDLAAAIVRPAADVGVSMDPAVVERLVSTVHDQAGALPLLQHALAEMFQSRTSDVMSTSDYEAVGGVIGSLAQRAESIFESLDPEDRQKAKQVFLQLVVLAEGESPLRRRVRLSELDYLEARTVIDSFARRRLLVYDRDPTSRAPTLEVAHEALFSHWPRLAGWVEDLQEDLILRRRLDEAVVEWKSNGSIDAYLLTGGRLSQHEEWTADTELSLSDSEKTFLLKSAEWNEQVVKRRRRIRTGVIAGFAAAALVASTFAVIASQRARETYAKELAASAIAVIEQDPELSVLLSLQAAQSDQSTQVFSALHTALQSHRASFVVDWPRDWLRFGFFKASMSPDGGLVALDGSGDVLEVWDTSDPTGPLWTKNLETDGWETPWFTSNGSMIIVPATFQDFLAASPDPSARYGIYGFDALTGNEVFYVNVDPEIYVAGMVPNSGSFIDIDHGLIPATFTGFYDVDLDTGELEYLADPVPFTYLQGDFTMSPDGRFLALGRQDPVVIHDLETGATDATLPGPFATFSPDGRQILVGGNPIRLWDLDRQAFVQTFAGDYWRVGFSADGRQFIGARFDGPTVVYDIDTGDRLFYLAGDAALTAQISSDGNRVFAAGSRAIVYDTEFRVQPETASIPLGDNPTHRLASALDVASGVGVTWDWETELNERTIQLFTTEPPEVFREVPGFGSALSPDGKLFAYQPTLGIESLTEEQLGEGFEPGDYLKVGPVQVADVQTGTLVAKLEGLCSWYESEATWMGKDYGQGPMVPGPDCDDFSIPDWPGDIEFSSDGSLLALSSTVTGTTGVWDATSGELIWRSDRILARPPIAPASVALSPNGQWLAASDGAETIVIDTHTFEEIVRVPNLGNQPFYEMEFTHDSSLLLASDQGNRVSVIDTATWEAQNPLIATEGEGVRDIDISPDSSLVVSAGDRLLRVWSLDDFSLQLEIEMGEQIRAVEFIDENHIIVLPVSQNAAAVITLDTDEILEIARSRLTRSFTDSECATYNIDPCPTLEEIKSG